MHIAENIYEAIVERNTILAGKICWKQWVVLKFAEYSYRIFDCRR